MSASFDAYKVFYYVGKFNNITHAANALFLSQSTVSRSIQSLEADLGCKLLERFQHGVILTAEGELLYSHVARACEDILLGEEKLKQLSTGVVSKIRLGVDNYVFTQFILPAMKDFQKDFPEVSIEFSSASVSSMDRCMQELLTGDTDAVFTLGPVPDTPGILTQNLGGYEDIFIAGKQFESLKRDRVRIYDVSLCPFVSLNRGISGGEYIRKAFASYGLRVEPNYQVEDFRHLLDMVDMGLGVALVPSPLLSLSKQRNNIFKIELSTGLPRRNICILTARSATHNVPCDELIRRIRKNMQTELL